MGGMEKLAGEVAHDYIKSAHNPIFHVIELYGLCIYLGGAKYCTGHKLVMDFKEHVARCTVVQKRRWCKETSGSTWNGLSSTPH